LALKMLRFRHGRACPGHPRRAAGGGFQKIARAAANTIVGILKADEPCHDVDGRDKPGHDADSVSINDHGYMRDQCVGAVSWPVSADIASVASALST
jgi:hypothetical protein